MAMRSVVFGRGSPLGSIMPGGDSVTFGLVGIQGGWRVGVEDVLLRHPNFSFVGPYDFGASPTMVWPKHYALPGQTAEAALTAAGGIGANVTLFNPDVLTCAWGINDLAGGKTPVQVRDFCAQIITDAKTAKPTIKIIQSSIVCQGCSENVGGNVTTLNGLLQALAVSTGSIWCNVGTPQTSDTIHPIDGPTGYGAMSGTFIQAILTAFA